VRRNFSVKQNLELFEEPQCNVSVAAICMEYGLTDQTVAAICMECGLTDQTVAAICMECGLTEQTVAAICMECGLTEQTVASMTQTGCVLRNVRYLLMQKAQDNLEKVAKGNMKP
jgi:predicted transcriptional regulator